MLLLEDISVRRQRDQARAEALGFVTHELRTPLMAIQGYAEFMMQYPDTSTTAEAPATIFRESRRLVAMINAYLDVLRMDVGARPLRLKPVAIGDMVTHVQQILQPLAQAARIDIQVNTDPAAQLLSCDGALITGALLNLVSNAVKYSPNGSTIGVHTTMKDGEVAFAVHNRGPAIPAKDLEHLFEPYYRASQHADSKPGWGLGLAFVKRISEQHGGRVEVKSDELSGTCFRLILPVSLPIASEVVL
jgi:signal transduction histidine kinase